MAPPGPSSTVATGLGPLFPNHATSGLAYAPAIRQPTPPKFQWVRRLQILSPTTKNHSYSFGILSNRFTAHHCARAAMRQSGLDSRQDVSLDEFCSFRPVCHEW